MFNLYFLKFKIENEIPIKARIEETEATKSNLNS